MKTTKQLGIWMDHSVAHLMEMSNDTIVSSTIESQPERQPEQQIVYKDESHSLNKEQGLLSAYYKKLGDVILDYEKVILFGPTDAKNELLNLLLDNHLYDNIKIAVKSADKMTDSQMSVFVKDYFNHPSQNSKTIQNIILAFIYAEGNENSKKKHKVSPHYCCSPR
jgi:hypothetical protein